MSNDPMKDALEYYAQDYDYERGCSVWDGGAKAREALAAPRWLPIEEAPRDGTPVLAYNSRAKDTPVVVKWHPQKDGDDILSEAHWGDAATADSSALYYNEHYFDWFMPLPAPPEGDPK